MTHRVSPGSGPPLASPTVPSKDTTARRPRSQTPEGGAAGENPKVGAKPRTQARTAKAQSVTFVSPLATWFDGERGQRAFRRTTLGRRPLVLAPRDTTWRSIAPGFREALTMTRSGLPFQIAVDRGYDRSGDRRHLTRALAAGATIFVPQVHQVLPRVMRLMVALRVAFLGPLREECSFLFLVNGRGRTGMGLHHDGDVDAFWLQLTGRRTVTIGPPVSAGTPQEMRRRPPAGDPRWTTIELRPGSLFHLPPRTPHEVICRGRSLALSLTWGPRRRGRRRGQTPAQGLASWDVASGRVGAVPRHRPDRLWTQVPVLAGPVRRRPDSFTLWTPDGPLPCPPSVRPLACRLGSMPMMHPAHAHDQDSLSALLERGILAPCDLPLRIVPDDAAELDGWHF